MINKEIKNLKYDAFISYSFYDGWWVHNYLLRELENAGLIICIDTRDFEIGIPAIENMQKAIESSRTTILILSRNWISSEWTAFESYILQSCDPTGLNGRVIPLLYEKCDIPRRLKILTYADCSDPNLRDEQIRKIISQIKNIDLKDINLLNERKKAIECKYIVIIEGRCEDVSESQLHEIQRMLRTLAKDHSLKIIKIENGSIVLRIEGTRDGFERINRLIQTDQLNKLMKYNFIGLTEIQDINEKLGKWVKIDTKIGTDIITYCPKDKIRGFDREHQIALKVLPPPTSEIKNISIYLTAKYVPNVGHYYYAHSNYQPQSNKYTIKLASPYFKDLETILYNIVKSEFSDENIVNYFEFISAHKSKVQYIFNEKIRKEDGSFEIDLKGAKNIKVIKEVNK